VHVLVVDGLIDIHLVDVVGVAVVVKTKDAPLESLGVHVVVGAATALVDGHHFDETGPAAAPNIHCLKDSVVVFDEELHLEVRVQ
jgi:hypothetical protein